VGALLHCEGVDCKMVDKRDTCCQDLSQKNTHPEGGIASGSGEGCLGNIIEVWLVAASEAIYVGDTG
jgi:hypothetical protein